MTTPEGLALLGAHDKIVARYVDAAVATVLGIQAETLDPWDLDGSAPRYEAAATAALRDYRESLARQSTATYSALREIETADLPRRPPPYVPVLAAVDAVSLATSLRVTGPVAVKRAMKKGLPYALSSAASQTAGMATRVVEGGGRGVMIGNSRRDPAARGWLRRSGGTPCPFCAMLISRGPVYTEVTARFAAHDNCHCKAVPFFREDGWTGQSREFKDLWEESRRTGISFESLYRDRYLSKAKALDVPDNVITLPPRTGLKWLDDMPRLTEVPVRASSDDIARLTAALNAADDEVQGILNRMAAAYGAGDDALYDSLKPARDAAREARVQAAKDLATARGGFDNIAKKVNPLHREVEGGGINCTFVSASYELRRRGYDVIARPRLASDPRPRGPLGDITSRWRQADGTERSFTTVSKKGDLLRTMEDDLPEGARAFIVNSWSGQPPTAHIFNAEKVDGKIVFTEAQTAGRAGDLDPQEYLSRFRRGNPVWYMRVDDLVPHDDLRDWVWRGDDIDGLRQRSIPRKVTSSIFG